jgi:hypothetical protein
VRPGFLFFIIFLFLLISNKGVGVSFWGLKCPEGTDTPLSEIKYSQPLKITPPTETMMTPWSRDVGMPEEGDYRTLISNAMWIFVASRYPIVGFVPKDLFGCVTGSANRNSLDKRQIIGAAYLCAAARIIVTDANVTTCTSSDHATTA